MGESTGGDGKQYRGTGKEQATWFSRSCLFIIEYSRSMNFVISSVGRMR